MKLPRNVKAKQLIKALKKMGFVDCGHRGSHVRLEHQGGRWTQVAVHPKPVPQGTLRAILKQAEVSAEELIEVL